MAQPPQKQVRKLPVFQEIEPSLYPIQFYDDEKHSDQQLGEFESPENKNNEALNTYKNTLNGKAKLTNESNEILSSNITKWTREYKYYKIMKTYYKTGNKKGEIKQEKLAIGVYYNEKYFIFGRKYIRTELSKSNGSFEGGELEKDDLLFLIKLKNQSYKNLKDVCNELSEKLTSSENTRKWLWRQLFNNGYSRDAQSGNFVMGNRWNQPQNNLD